MTRVKSAYMRRFHALSNTSDQHAGYVTIRCGWWINLLSALRRTAVIFLGRVRAALSDRLRSDRLTVN